MDKTEIYDKLKGIFSEILQTANITLESRMVEDLGCDSLDLVELIMSVEDQFDVDINDDEVEKIVTVQDAVNLLYPLVNIQD